MRWVDLTLPIRHGHVGHPRGPYPLHPARVEVIAAPSEGDLQTLREQGMAVAEGACTGYPFIVSRLCLVPHPFTHIDAPLHAGVGGPDASRLRLEQTCGEAVILDFTHKQPGETISAAELEAAGPDVDASVIPVVRTGWTDRAWGTPRFYTEGIYFTYDAADWFLAKGVRALACDCLPEVNVYDPRLPQDPQRYLHTRLLGSGMVFIVNLCNLGALRTRRVMLMALPLKVEGAEAVPARVVAWEIP